MSYFFRTNDYCVLQCDKIEVLKHNIRECRLTGSLWEYDEVTDEQYFLAEYENGKEV